MPSFLPDWRTAVLRYRLYRYARTAFLLCGGKAPLLRTLNAVGAYRAGKTALHSTGYSYRLLYSCAVSLEDAAGHHTGGVAAIRTADGGRYRGSGICGRVGGFGRTYRRHRVTRRLRLLCQRRLISRGQCFVA